jgi:hypothetical protein
MVVQSTGADQVVVWDGQQRLATTVILLATVRDYAHSVEDDQSALEIANDLHSRYIVPGGIFETARESIRLGATDRKTVGALVLRRIGEAGKADLSFLTGLPSAVRKQDWSPSIIAAFEYFDRQLHLLLEVEGVRRTNWLGNVQALMTTLLRRFDVIVAETSDANDAFMTFQTLNDRGLGLSAADLLKNFFLSETESRDDREEAASRWEEMAQALGGDYVPTYLRHFHMARYGLVSRPRLYKTMVTLTKPDSEGHRAIEPQDLLRDIADYGEPYLRLVRPSLEGGAWTDSMLISRLHTLEALKATQWSPVGLAALMVGATESELGGILQVIEALIVREIVVIGRNPNAFEKIFAAAAQRLWKDGRGGDETRRVEIDRLKHSLATEFSPPALFEAAFQELHLTAQRARVLLDLMERTLQRETFGGARPDLLILDIEHIYPKTDGAGWPQPSDVGYASTDDRNYLGNLTLLHFTLNRSQRNQPFSAKRTRFAASQLLLTQPLGDEQAWPAWDLGAIRRRQTALRMVGERTWPLPAGIEFPGPEEQLDEEFDRRHVTLQDVLVEFSPFVGMSVDDVASDIGVSKSDSKSYAANVVRKAIAGLAPGGSLDSLPGGSPTLRTPRVSSDMMPYEAVSFPAFSNIELSHEEWATSALRAELEFVLFAPVQGLTKEMHQGQCKVLRPVEWHPSPETLDAVRREWTMYRDLIRGGRKDLPGASDTAAIHVRPHGRDASDVDETGGTPITKKSFWLNKELVASILRGERT